MQSAIVYDFKTKDLGIERRLLDLGIIKGNEITPLFASPARNPIAYQVKESVIALRNDITDQILVYTKEEDDACGK